MIEIPPSMPRRGLKVRRAYSCATPREIVTANGFGLFGNAKSLDACLNIFNHFAGE